MLSLPTGLRLRLASSRDADGIANLYHRCNVANSTSFMSSLGEPFLRAYYSITLRAPYAVAICAENTHGQLLGFATGTLNAADQMSRLSRARFKLLWAATPRIIRNPGLFSAMRRRSRPGNNEFIITTGARWEYWAWDPEARVPGGALLVHSAWLHVVRGLGVRAISTEVNRSDSNVIRIHKQAGANIVKEIQTPDGLARVIMEYRFK